MSRTTSRPGVRPGRTPEIRALFRPPFFVTLSRLLLASCCAALIGCGGGGGNSAAVAEPTPTEGTDGTVGLAARPANNSCLAPARTFSGNDVALTDAFPTLPNLDTPIKIIQPINDSSVWYAVLRNGGLERFSNTPGASTAQRYLDLPVSAAGEGGFLSAVLDPDWPTTKALYVSYTESGSGFLSVLSRLVITDDSTLPARFTEERLLTVTQPFTNHNGGDIAFGPDGYLYYSMGDGGDSGDPQDFGQNTTRLLGTVMRIDVSAVAYPSPGYRIPSDNPFAGNSRCGPDGNAASCPEIFAWGLRNPWRMSFDAVTGALWAGDVGQGAREEINLIRAGENYGWRCREGSQPFNLSGCASGGFAEPEFDYGRSAGDRSVTGGYVYRGAAVPALAGKYLFGDFASGRIWSLENQGSGYLRHELASIGAVAGFSQGNDGEVYVLDIGAGRVLRFEGSGGTRTDNVPDDLADTGCFTASDPALPAPGLIPYQPAAPFWSDGADKARWVALPDNTSIDTATDPHWTFPPGTVLAKHFEIGSVLIETRLFMRHPDGGWAGYTYRWNDSGTAASRVRSGATRDLGSQTWTYPSEADCLGCHTAAAGFVLGLEVAQLNNDFSYAQSDVTDNQLEVFNHIGLFTNDLPEPVSALPALSDPVDFNAPLDDRARAYLHTNCAQCHRPGGPTGTDLDLRYDTPLAATNTCDTVPQTGSLGIVNARLLAPGDPGRSMLLVRTNRRDANAMPPLASNAIDSDGVSLLTEWINSISRCP